MRTIFPKKNNYNFKIPGCFQDIRLKTNSSMNSRNAPGWYRETDGLY